MSKRQRNDSNSSQSSEESQRRPYSQAIEIDDDESDACHPDLPKSANIKVDKTFKAWEDKDIINFDVETRILPITLGSVKGKNPCEEGICVFYIAGHCGAWSMDPMELAGFHVNTMVPLALEKYAKQTIQEEIPKGLRKDLEVELFPHIRFKPGPKGISLRMARRWLRKEGFQWTYYKKGLYFETSLSLPLKDTSPNYASMKTFLQIHAKLSLSLTLLMGAGWTIPIRKKGQGHGDQALLMFDNSTGHVTLAKDALNTKHMNVGHGGAQAKLRNGWWVDVRGERHTEQIVYEDGTPKGMKVVLQERNPGSPACEKSVKRLPTIVMITCVVQRDGLLHSLISGAKAACTGDP
ncbi:hypothetical protein BT69DRAFT_1291630 [Atractiella rhizophila]|nr:hypothetical protein BT69DRAFT_1291630 [Atractiella rhizophila]